MPKVCTTVACGAARTLALLLISLGLARTVDAQGVVHVGNEAQLASAIANAISGDTIVFDANVTLTADLPSLSTNLTIEGNGHTLSGADQHRGFFVGAFGAETATPTPVTVYIQNIQIVDAKATGGNGGNGQSGGGAGTGLGGGLYVADNRSEEHTSELQSLRHLVCRLPLEKKKQ